MNEFLDIEEKINRNFRKVFDAIDLDDFIRKELDKKIRDMLYTLMGVKKSYGKFEVTDTNTSFANFVESKITPKLNKQIEEYCKANPLKMTVSLQRAIDSAIHSQINGYKFNQYLEGIISTKLEALLAADKEKIEEAIFKKYTQSKKIKELLCYEPEPIKYD